MDACLNNIVFMLFLLYFLYIYMIQKSQSIYHNIIFHLGSKSLHFCKKNLNLDYNPITAFEIRTNTLTPYFSKIYFRIVSSDKMEYSIHSSKYDPSHELTNTIIKLYKYTSLKPALWNLFKPRFHLKIFLALSDINSSSVKIILKSIHIKIWSILEIHSANMI